MLTRQKGFGLVEVIIVIVIIGLLAGVGWLVYDRQKSQTTTDSGAQTAQEPVAQPNPYANWKSYASTKGGFTIKYPSDWLVTGYKGTAVIAAADLKGDEDQLRIQQKSEVGNTVDNFAINFTVGASVPDYGVGSDLSKLGKVTLVNKDISVLDENKTKILPSGEQANNCPTLWVVKDNAIGMQLKNGQYLDFSGSYCWGEGMTSSLSFEQQKSSQPYKDALLVVKSFTYN